MITGFENPLTCGEIKKLREMIYGTETQPRVQVPIDNTVNTSIFSRIESSVRAVKAGDADRQDMGKDISVYKVGKTIRVDIKNLDVIED